MGEITPLAACLHEAEANLAQAEWTPLKSYLK